MKQEIWKNIIGYKGEYQISSFGRVKSFKSGVGKILKIKTDRNGYQSINLCSNGQIKRVRIHRLVATAFLVRKNKKSEVNHKDGNKKNNTVTNLEWVNKSENCMHAYVTKLRKPSPSLGEKHGMSKLSNSDVFKIRKLRQKTNMSFASIGKKFGVMRHIVSRIVSGLAWKHI